MEILSIEPQFDRVLIKPVDLGEKRHGAILIADMGQERPEIGQVCAVGPGRYTEFGQFIETNLEVGDYVLVPKIGTLRVEVEGEEYFICPEKEVLAVVDVTEEEEGA